jgi:hypothetical protein
MGPMERLALSWGKCPAVYPAAAGLSLLSHIGMKRPAGPKLGTRELEDSHSEITRGSKNAFLRRRDQNRSLNIVQNVEPAQSSQTRHKL